MEIIAALLVLCGLVLLAVIYMLITGEDDNVQIDADFVMRKCFFCDAQVLSNRHAKPHTIQCAHCFFQFGHHGH